MQDALSKILTLARAGAVGGAWDAFVAAELGDVVDDPKVLTLKGRLLKDQAREAKGDARLRLFLRSARAYAEAATLKPDSYPLINAAAMSLFAGQADHARQLANEVLALIQTGVGGGETPYWHAATRAEAHLLLDSQPAAQASFDQAIAHAPKAWEDRATTLRQFRLILQHRGEDSSWLDRYAPPASLYYSGIMRLGTNDPSAHSAIDGAVDEIRPAFGYGALAAGADIVIAERLLNNGAELHVFLPGNPAHFRETSVEPFGPDWGKRFDRLFEMATTVNVMEPGAPITGATVQLASQVAIGHAVDNAQRLQSSVAVLNISAPDKKADATQFPAVASIMTITLDRSMVVSNLTLPQGQLSACLAIDAHDYDAAKFVKARSVERDQGFIFATFDFIGDAADALFQHRRSQQDGTIAIDYRASDGGQAPVDMHRSRILRIIQAAVPGTIVAGAEAAMALKAMRAELRLEPLGDLPSHEGPVTLYTLRQ